MITVFCDIGECHCLGVCACIFRSKTSWCLLWNGIASGYMKYDTILAITEYRWRAFGCSWHCFSSFLGVGNFSCLCMRILRKPSPLGEKCCGTQYVLLRLPCGLGEGFAGGEPWSGGRSPLWRVLTCPAVQGLSRLTQGSFPGSPWIGLLVAVGEGFPPWCTGPQLPLGSLGEAQVMLARNPLENKRSWIVLQ